MLKWVNNEIVERLGSLLGGHPRLSRQSMIDHITPVNVQYSEYSLEFATNISWQQLTKSISDSRLRGLHRAVAMHTRVGDNDYACYCHMPRLMMCARTRVSAQATMRR
eukprot:3465799-Pyramimonas_sp.AAC.1